MEKTGRRTADSLPSDDADEIKIRNLLIILLGANERAPIIGRVRLVKTFFRVCKLYFKEEYEIAEFFSDLYGPNSAIFSKQVNLQMDLGIISAEKKKGRWEYKLSDEGKELYDDVSGALPDTTKVKIGQIKEELSNKSTDIILSEVYKDYPEFAKRAVRKDLAAAELYKAKIKKIEEDQRNKRRLLETPSGLLIDMSYPVFYKEMVNKTGKEREYLEVQQLSQFQHLIKNRFFLLKELISDFRKHKESGETGSLIDLKKAPWLLTPYQFTFVDEKVLESVKSKLMKLPGEGRDFPDIILRYGSTVMGELFLVVKTSNEPFTLRDLYLLEFYCITLENILHDQGNQHHQIKGVLMGSDVNLECKEELDDINIYFFVHVEKLLEEVELSLSSLLSDLEINK